MNFILYVIAVILFLITLLFIGYLFYTYFFLSEWGKYPPFVPSFGTMKKIAAREALAILGSSSHPLKIADLGCGTGISLAKQAKTFPQHQFVGYEWDFLPNFIGQMFRKQEPNLQIKNRNFMTEDLREYDLILCFLSNEIATELGVKLLKELRPGSTIISSAFSFPGLTCLREISAKTYGFMPIKVFIYQI